VAPIRNNYPISLLINLARSTPIEVIQADLWRVRQIFPRRSERWFYYLDAAFRIWASYRFFYYWRRSRWDIPALRALAERVVQGCLGVSFSSAAEIDGGMVIFHGYGLVVNAKVCAGRNLTLYHRVTLGERFPGDACPHLGDEVTIGCGAGIFGPVELPDGYRVSANSVLTPRRLMKQP